MKSSHELFGREHRVGWNKLVDDLITDLNKMGTEWTLTQCKEKFGGLRFYAHNCTPEQYDLIHEYEEKSFIICEVCGKKGILREALGWVQTLCWEHYAKELETKMVRLHKLMEQDHNGN